MSLKAQRAELESLASTRSLEIVTAFEDAVLSGSSDDRPAFQELIAAIKDRSRGWSYVLVYDTSRIARGRFIAQAFRRECKRHGVELVIARLPETDPISAVILEAVFEAMDEVHSIMSRDKGLAGMRQNVAHGWRAGGRAPHGYELKHEPTGAMRDGKPVLKSKLVPASGSEVIGQYLLARAACEPRSAVVKRLGFKLSTSTLVAMEWNALVYAGHTVWNRHKEKRARGDGQSKQRPRSEWVVKRDTHPALITELQAEAIIAQLTNSTLAESIRQARTHNSNFLLAGLMFTADGRPWVGAGVRYRLKPANGGRGRYVNREAIESAVIAQVRADSASTDFLEQLAAKTRDWYPESDPGQELERDAKKLDQEAERAARLAMQTSEPGPLLAIMEGRRKQAAALRTQAEAARKDQAAFNATRKITAQSAADAISVEQSDAALIRGLVSRVILEPDLACRIDYMPALSRSLNMASPQRLARSAMSSKLVVA